MKTSKRIHHHVKYPELSAEWYDFLAEHHVFPEIYFSAEDLDRLSREEILGIEKPLHERNLGLSIHAPFLDLSPGAFDDKVREVAQFRLGQILDVAEILKPNLIDCHPHYDRYRFGGRVDAWVENCAKTFDPLVKRAEKLKIVLAMENVFEDEPTPIARLIDKIGSSSLQACFDNGHFHIFHTVSMKKWWETLGNKTALLHIHDNHGEKDEHLPIGDGNFPFPAYFNLLKEYTHPMTYTLESRSLADAKRSLRSLRKFLD